MYISCISQPAHNLGLAFTSQLYIHYYVLWTFSLPTCRSIYSHPAALAHPFIPLLQLTNFTIHYATSPRHPTSTTTHQLPLCPANLQAKSFPPLHNKGYSVPSLQGITLCLFHLHPTSVLLPHTAEPTAPHPSLPTREATKQLDGVLEQWGTGAGCTSLVDVASDVAGSLGIGVGGGGEEGCSWAEAVLLATWAAKVNLMLQLGLEGRAKPGRRSGWFGVLEGVSPWGG